MLKLLLKLVLKLWLKKKTWFEKNGYEKCYQMVTLEGIGYRYVEWIRVVFTFCSCCQPRHFPSLDLPSRKWSGMFFLEMTSQQVAELLGTNYVRSIEYAIRLMIKANR